MKTRSEKNKKIFNEIKKEELHHKLNKFIKITFIILLVLGFIFLYIYYIEPYLLTTNEYYIESDKIPDSFYGTKIVQLSDLLYKGTTNKKTLENLSKEIKKINPNIIFYTGDLVHPLNELNENDIETLKDFFHNLPSNIGKYAVLGENDDVNTYNLILDNYTILDNESILVYASDNNPISINGIDINNDDFSSKDNDYFNITLIHNYDKYASYQIKSDLVIAGHNLGGEIKLFNKKGLLGKNFYRENYYEEENTKIYINNGIGSINHLRFMNIPSINVYRLY